MNEIYVQTGFQFSEVSLVQADIRSKWQAHFMQIFPIADVYDKLPAEHESDKACFDKYWLGPKGMTFEQFKAGDRDWKSDPADKTAVIGDRGSYEQ